MRASMSSQTLKTQHNFECVKIKSLLPTIEMLILIKNNYFLLV